MPGVFEKFCEGLSARYGTRIDYYEIGNEWDLGFHGTFDEAVDIQREAYVGLKRGCPDVCVIPNGWTSPGDTPGIVKRGRAGLHEHFLRKARDYFDVHPIHCHGPFVPYVRSIKDGFFPFRARTGVKDKPWYSNETALTSVWSERNAALTVWKKILWAWAHGSVDYIWYNLKGTGWDPKDSEQGYGLITADFRPRDSYVSFAALATVVGGATFKSRVIDDGGTFCFEFAKGDSIVLTAWDEAGTGREIPVQTDAARAWHVDLMGNRTAVPLADGKAVFTGLRDGTYYLRETRAPEGYSLNAGEAVVVVKNGHAEVGTVTANDFKKGIPAFLAAGGRGFGLFVFSGAAFFAAGIALLFSVGNRKKGSRASMK